MISYISSMGVMLTLTEVLNIALLVVYRSITS